MSTPVPNFASWLDPAGPVAVVVREPLQPAAGEDAVFFPPTFAPPAKGEPPYYVIDTLGETKVAIVDTVGSQANRLEPLFKDPPYSELVPQAIISIDQRRVNLLDAGHRAADALVRFSSKAAELSAAFRAIEKNGDATQLARLAPTSLVFGAWDSRDTGVKLPRLIGSTIRAFDVQELTRAAQFFSAFEKEETETFEESQDFLSEQGFSDAPAGRTHGGIVARGGVRRETILNLTALRALKGADAAATGALQNYILGLCLVALTAPVNLFLREGCILISAKDAATEEAVFRNGDRQPLSLTPDAALHYARTACAAFGKGPDWQAAFEKAAVGSKSQEKAKKAAAKKEKKTKA
jgi:CRISPR-associated protein Csb1